MHRILLIQTAGRLAAALGILTALLLLAGVGTASADFEKPVILPPSAAGGNVSPFPNCISVNWFHSGSGVAYFTVERESPAWGQGGINPAQRDLFVCGMEPSTTYRFEVCAYFAIEDADEACSGWKELRTGAPETPPASQRPNTPRIVEHHAGETWIGVKWDAGYDYDSYFVNYTLKAAPGAPPNGPRTIHHDDDGTWGYQRVDGLLPGRTYTFHVQGCTETIFGLGEDHCWDWSAPYEVQTTGSSLSQPQLTATAVGDRQINLSWDVPADEGVNRIALSRDGADLGAIVTSAGDHIFEDKRVRPNTEYRYRVCFTNAGGDETCSDPVTAMVKPVAPTAPADVKVARAHLGGGTILDGAIRTAPRAAVDVTWRNTDVPGQFITVEGLDRVPGDVILGGAARTAPQERWIEATRVSAKDDPTSLRVDLPRSIISTDTPLTTFRVCAVVPALGDAGKACSQPVSLP